MNPTDISAMIRRALFLSKTSEVEVMASMTAFRDFAAQVVRLSMPDCAVVWLGLSTLRMTGPTSKAVRTLTLTRMFDRLDRQAPERSLHALVANLSSLVAADPSSVKDDLQASLSKVVPLLKSSEYAAGNAAVLRREHLQSGHDPDLHSKLSWEVNSQVVAFPVINEPHGYRFITGNQVAASGLTAFEIKDIAIQNVRDVADMLSQSDYSEGSMEFSGLDGMASALVLLPEFLEREAERAGGPICLMSGDADHLYIVPLANEEFLDFVLDRVARGSLRLPEMPPLVYRDGILEAPEIHEKSTYSR